jgi:hypothetical protein
MQKANDAQLTKMQSITLSRIERLKYMAIYMLLCIIYIDSVSRSGPNPMSAVIFLAMGVILPLPLVKW